MKAELRWVTTNKHNSPAAGATQGYLCLFAAVTCKATKDEVNDKRQRKWFEN